MTATDLHGWDRYTRTATVEDTITDFCGEFANNINIPALANAFRTAINAALSDTGISLHGNHFYAHHAAPEDAHDLITSAIEGVDLSRLASDFDTAGPHPPDRTNQTFRVVIAETWTRVLDAPAAADAARWTIDQWAEENGQEVHEITSHPYTRAADGSYEGYEFRADGTRYVAFVYDHERG